MLGKQGRRAVAKPVGQRHRDNGTVQSAYAKRLGNNSRVPPHLEDICTADAAIGGRKRGRRERLLYVGSAAKKKCKYVPNDSQNRTLTRLHSIFACELSDKTSKTINTALSVCKNVLICCKKIFCITNDL